jgi:hypothetical protein
VALEGSRGPLTRRCVLEETGKTVGKGECMSASGEEAVTPGSSVTLLKLNRHEARTVAALFDRMFPADENSPSA